jgi:acyl-CoA synthetase (AMP-forming)/AMP-acid ligase II
VKTPITLGRRFLWGGHSLDSLPRREEPFPVQPVSLDDTAAVLFTTGSTGPAKGVIYTHGTFGAQIEILRREYGIGPGDVDLPCFPLFGLFSTALGATAVIPDMDPSRPAFVAPHAIVDPIVDHAVTYSFGSPTLWARVSAHCVQHGVTFLTLRRVIMAGAPVPGDVHENLLRHVLPPGAQTYTPYGATESLPVANFTGEEMLAETDAQTRAGAGMCVGRPLPEVRVRIIRIEDRAIETIDECADVQPGEIGEIIVCGSVVTRSYDHLPEATRLAKIADGDSVWHRMGDVGYVDREGRIWFCGRKSHRVITLDRTLYTVCCEAIFNEIFDVARSALVGIGPDRRNQTPVIVIEPRPDRFPRSARAREAFRETVLTVAGQSELTAGIRHVLFHRAFPVDIRHNAKIRREILAAWASRRLRL